MPDQSKRISAYLLPGGVKDPRPALDQARRAETLGLGGLWLGERIDTKDFPALLGAITQVTEHIRLGVGVTPMNLRHPMVLASAGQTLQALSNGRFRMGFGKSAEWRWSGYGIPEPTIASMRDVANILRRLWAGETVAYHGPAGNYPGLRLPERIEMAPPPLYLAAVGPKTLAMAGAVYDGVILHPFLTREGVRTSVDIVRNAAADAGRDPASITVVCAIVAAPDRTPHDADLAIRSRGAGYFQIKGLGDMLVQANGWSATDLAAYRKHPRLLALEGKPADKYLSRDELIELTRAMPEHWIPSSSASGSSAEVAAIFREYLAAGADEILVHGSTAEYLGGVLAALRT